MPATVRSRARQAHAGAPRVTTPEGEWAWSNPATTGLSPQAEALFALPFPELLYRAQRSIATGMTRTQVQMSTLLSIKTGACPEDCAYCPQSMRYDTGVASEALMPLDDGARARARRARRRRDALLHGRGVALAQGAGTCRRSVAMVREVHALGLETCATLGMLTGAQAQELKDAGLDYYNHNLDTSEDYYREIISTRTYQDRLDTLEAVRAAGLNVCCGGIVGMGESARDRAQLLVTLACLPQHPQSVPINQLVRVAGTPLADAAPVDPFDFVRTIAVARIMLPRAQVRLSAGRSADER